jgi:hypothetical protein
MEKEVSAINLRVEPTLPLAMSFFTFLPLVLLNFLQWKKNSNTLCGQCIATHF